jgi:hypothetical protein
MLRPNASASSGGSALSAFLLSAALLSSFLTACKPKDVRPSSAPEVRCAQPRTADVPDWPAEWLLEGPAYTISILGILAEERRLTAIEHGCLDTLREKGVIR